MALVIDPSGKIKAKLSRVDTGEPLINKTIYFHEAGSESEIKSKVIDSCQSSALSARTGSDGWAEVSKDLTYGKWYGACFPGDDTYDRSGAYEVFAVEIVRVDVPDRVDPGQTFNISVIVKNHADRDIDTNVIIYDHKGSEVTKQSVILKRGEEKSITFTVSAPSESGTYMWTAISKRINKYGLEQVEGERKFTVNVGVVGKLEIVSVEVPEYVYTGDTFTVKVRVRNTYSEDKTVDVKLMIDFPTKYESTKSVTVKANSEEEVSFTVTAPDVEGTYSWKVELIHDGTVVDSESGALEVRKRVTAVTIAGIPIWVVLIALLLLVMLLLR